MVERNVNEEVDRVIKWILTPLLLILLFLMTIIPEVRSSGAIALVLIGFSYLIYFTPRFQQDLIGIPDNIFQGIGWGFGLFAFFFILMKIVPALAIGVPTVPQSVETLEFSGFALGGLISISLIGIFYPIAETIFKASAITILMQTYRLTVVPTVALIAVFFSSLHFFAYGIQVSILENFGVLVQQLNQTGGLFLAAGIFGAFATALLIKTKNIIWVAVAHILINLTIINVIFSFVQFA